MLSDSVPLKCMGNFKEVIALAEIKRGLLKNGQWIIIIINRFGQRGALFYE